MEKTHHYIYRRDGKVHFYKTGEEVYAGSRDGREHGWVNSGEPIIFLHATAGCGHTWDKCIDYFAKEFTCYVIDGPGHDESDIPPRKYTMTEYADAILDVIDAIGLPQANIVADHTGAMYALDLAVRFPQRVKKMVLDGLPYWNGERSKVVWEKFFVPSYTDMSAYHVPVVPLTTLEEAKKKNPNMNVDDWKHSQEIYKKSRLWTRYGQEANTSYDTEGMGPRCKTPTLLIYGEGDILRRGEQRANEGIKGSILRVIPGSPSAAHRGKPEEFARLSTAYLKGEKLPGVGFTPSVAMETAKSR